MNGNEQTAVALKGLAGTAASATGTWISFFTEVELALRIGSLLVGIAVGTITFISIWRTHKNRKK